MATSTSPAQHGTSGRKLYYPRTHTDSLLARQRSRPGFPSAERRATDQPPAAPPCTSAGPLYDDEQQLYFPPPPPPPPTSQANSSTAPQLPYAYPPPPSPHPQVPPSQQQQQQQQPLPPLPLLQQQSYPAPPAHRPALASDAGLWPRWPSHGVVLGLPTAASAPEPQPQPQPPAKDSPAADDSNGLSSSSGIFVGATATTDDVGTFNGGGYRVSHRDSNTLLTVQLAVGCPLTVKPGACARALRPAPPHLPTSSLSTDHAQRKHILTSPRAKAP